MWERKQPMKYSNDHTLISRGTTIKGDIHFSGELQIEGCIQGNVVADAESAAKIVVAETGTVQGEIRVPTVVINGNIQGDIYSAKHLELAAKAVVDGSVHYQLIEMVKGAQVNGNLVFLGAQSAKSVLAEQSDDAPASTSIEPLQSKA